MASQNLLKQIHALVKKGFPNATYVSISINGSKLIANPTYEVGQKAYRTRDINSTPVDECSEEGGE